MRPAIDIRNLIICLKTVVRQSRRPDFLGLGRLQPLANRLAPAPLWAFASAEEWDAFSEFCRRKILNPK
jgi:hypothetical protein